jgi:hypothetical protein
MLGGDDTVDGSITNDLIFGNEGEDIISGEFWQRFFIRGKREETPCLEKREMTFSTAVKMQIFL